MNQIVFLAVLLIIPGVTSANCEFGERNYPEGTKIGGLICSENGKWITKKEWETDKEQQPQTNT